MEQQDGQWMAMIITLLRPINNMVNCFSQEGKYLRLYSTLSKSWTRKGGQGKLTLIKTKR